VILLDDTDGADKLRRLEECVEALKRRCEERWVGFEEGEPGGWAWTLIRHYEGYYEER